MLLSDKGGFNSVKRPFRYDFFTIWGNAFEYADEILQILRQEEYLEIIRIESLRVEDITKFVFDLYACDTVPIKHLRAKLRYLFEVPPEILTVFVRNLAPEEAPAGKGAFRKVQCQYINRLKWGMREIFNPRKDGVRTEEHVIHASDYEEQVDYLLKIIGYKDGIIFLHGDGDGLPFEKPYHIKRPRSYTFRTVAIKSLRASMLSGSPSVGTRAEKYLVPIEETPHFRALRDEVNVYADYVQRYRYTWLKDDHYPGKLLNMKELDLGQVRSFEPILVIREGDAFRILDGVHRAAVSLYWGLPSMKCVEFEC